MDRATDLRTSRLLSELGDPHAGATITLEELLDSFRQRAFGVLLLMVLLPTFIPVPIGVGGVTGPLIALVGLQMLLTLQHPWLPKWISRHRIKRRSVQHFGERFRPLLERLERISKPRMPVLVEHIAAYCFSGLLLVLLGLLLSLPVPFTNYPLGIIILLYCIGLIERDGLLLLIGWILGIVAIGASVLLSNEVVELIGRWLG